MQLGLERHFIDLHGERWTVREIEARTVPNAPRATCLIFESGNIVRRVWDFPPHWRAVSEAELEVISWRR